MATREYMRGQGSEGIELLRIQYQQDSDLQERQQERELASNDAHRKRELGLEAARLIAEHSNGIFEGSAEVARENRTGL